MILLIKWYISNFVPLVGSLVFGAYSTGASPNDPSKLDPCAPDPPWVRTPLIARCRCELQRPPPYRIRHIHMTTVFNVFWALHRSLWFKLVLFARTIVHVYTSNNFKSLPDRPRSASIGNMKKYNSPDLSSPLTISGFVLDEMTWQIFHDEIST